MSVKRAPLVVALAAILLTLMSPAYAGKYTPGSGPTFNSPLGNGATQQSVNNKIVRTINSTPRNQAIEIMTWNFASPQAVRALLKAQKRGVKVRLLMAKGNRVRINNPSFRQLRNGLQRGNRSEKRRSWARTCVQSCRGRGGAAHAKYYLFTKSGKAKRVVIQGSANLTTAAARNQWNDVITMRKRKGPYRFMRTVFKQMVRDKPRPNPYTSWRQKQDRLVFFPDSGKRSVDPVMQTLNQVRCRGARNTGNGRTRVLIAPDAIREQRGMRVGRKIRSLWNQGCNIRVGYTVMGIDIGRMLRSRGGRGPVPLVHQVQDRNNDGQFDNYFHMKAMTVVGRLGRNRSAYKMLNGSANISNAAARSDENIGIYARKGLTLRYEEHLNYWYRFFARANSRTTYRTDFARAAREQGRLEDGLLFGTGPINGVDPYANVEMD